MGFFCVWAVTTDIAVEALKLEYSGYVIAVVEQ
jgi:hypothetical protein